MIRVNLNSDLREQTTDWKMQKQTIGFVPTMGNLHQGHLSLVEHANKVADKVVTSIFVNPSQFVKGEDFATYPRTIEEDLAVLKEANVDLVYIPDEDQLFPTGWENVTEVTVPKLDNIFCGKTRPGHFKGVATIVTKLFNLVRPDLAVFGKKDYQQLLVIKNTVDDLNLPVEIIGSPTVRENDGLAMSSRNQYLTPAERKIAPVLYQVLSETAEKVSQTIENIKELESSAVSKLEQAGFMVDYFNVCEADDLSEPKSNNLVILVAAWLGKARLIDNIQVDR